MRLGTPIALVHRAAGRVEGLTVQFWIPHRPRWQTRKSASRLCRSQASPGSSARKRRPHDRALATRISLSERKRTPPHPRRFGCGLVSDRAPTHDLCRLAEGVLLLGIIRPDGRYISVPSSVECLEPARLLRWLLGLVIRDVQENRRLVAFRQVTTAGPAAMPDRSGHLWSAGPKGFHRAQERSRSGGKFFRCSYIPGRVAPPTTGMARP